jgi:tRNA A-37 threonylcarbamoyl transferase component Bud32/tetratricopeptide (TPR) repeat protein
MNSPRPALSPPDWIRLNDLLKHALELDEQALASWTAGLPSGDAPLLPLLRELLTQPAPDGTDIEGRLSASVTSVAADALAAMRRDQPGDRVGPWQLERLLAEGGMGDVWLASRADGVVQRTVALKLPRAEWVDRGLALRIARERTILARLQHPHIAVLYDAGLGADGRPYLALEYVEGRPIDVWCKDKALRDIVRLFVQLARAVAHAHAHLIIHRDLKPTNVLVMADGTPKLLDFGISKLIEGEDQSAGATELTRLGGHRLTLAYAAPEQVLGEPVSVASDVYALGVMLFELVTGRRLYVSSDAHAIQAEVLRGEPRRPSGVASHQRARALRGDIDAIVLTALQRDPAKRYASASSLADDLESHLAGLPVRARPDGRLYRLRKFVARNTWPVAAGTVVVLALGIGLGVALSQASRATALTNFVLSLIRQADPNASRQTREADLATLKSIEDKIAEEFKGSPAQRLNLQLTVAEAYRNRGEMMAARRAYQRAVDDAAPHIPVDDLMLLTARVRASDATLIVSTAASQQLDEAVDVLKGKLLRSDAEDELLIDALLTRQVLQILYGLPAHVPNERRLDAGRQAEALAIEVFGQGSRQHLRAVNVLENWVKNIEGTAAARGLLEAAVRQALARSDGTSDSTEFRIAEAKLAALRCEQGVAPDSIAALESSIETVRAAHGATSVLLEQQYLALGRCQRAAGIRVDVLAAVKAYEVGAARERPPSTHLRLLALLALDASMRAHQLSDADRFFRSAMDNAEAIPEPELRQRLTAPPRILQVCVLAWRGEAEAAERMAGPLIADADAVWQKVRRLTPWQGELWTCLMRAQRQQGHFDQALHTIRTYIERLSATQLAQVRLGVGEGLIERTFVELDTGRPAAAKATMDERMAISREMRHHPTFGLAYGRVLLANGQAAEAIEPLQGHHEHWASLQANSPFTAEASYWLGRAYEAVGDSRGRSMVAQARTALAHSPVASHRRLADERP